MEWPIKLNFELNIGFKRFTETISFDRQLSRVNKLPKKVSWNDVHLSLYKFKSNRTERRVMIRKTWILNRITHADRGFIMNNEQASSLGSKYNFRDNIMQIIYLIALYY